MGYVVRQRIPVMIEKGVATTLSVVVYDDAGDVQTPTAATLTLLDGAEKVLDAVSATAGATSTYSLLAATTTSRNTSMRLLLEWTLTLGGVPTVVRQMAYLVRRVYHPSITDADLTALHTDLDEIRPRTLTSYEGYRTRADERLQRILIQKGRRPDLIFDAWSLVDAHVFLALHYLFADFATDLSGASRFKELSKEYLEKFDVEIGRVNFRYDAADLGTIDGTPSTQASGPIAITAGRPGFGRYPRGRAAI